MSFSSFRDRAVNLVRGGDRVRGVERELGAGDLEWKFAGRDKAFAGVLGSGQFGIGQGEFEVCALDWESVSGLLRGCEPGEIGRIVEMITANHESYLACKRAGFEAMGRGVESEASRASSRFSSTNDVSKKYGNLGEWRRSGITSPSVTSFRSGASGRSVGSPSVACVPGDRVTAGTEYLRVMRNSVADSVVRTVGKLPTLRELVNLPLDNFLMLEILKARSVTIEYGMMRIHPGLLPQELGAPSFYQVVVALALDGYRGPLMDAVDVSYGPPSASWLVGGVGSLMNMRVGRMECESASCLVDNIQDGMCYMRGVACEMVQEARAVMGLSPRFVDFVQQPAGTVVPAPVARQHQVTLSGGVAHVHSCLKSDSGALNLADLLEAAVYQGLQGDALQGFQPACHAGLQSVDLRSLRIGGKFAAWDVCADSVVLDEAGLVTLHSVVDVSKLLIVYTPGSEGKARSLCRALQLEGVVRVASVDEVQEEELGIVWMVCTRGEDRCVGGLLSSMVAGVLMRAQNSVLVQATEAVIDSFNPGIQPGIKVVREWCDVCNFRVNPVGHAERCQVRSVPAGRDARQQLLAGSLHGSDVTQVLSMMRIADDQLTIESAQYVSGDARKKYLKELEPNALPEVASVASWAKLFKSRYKGDFRVQYLRWLIRDCFAKWIVMDDGHVVLREYIDGVVERIFEEVQNEIEAVQQYYDYGNYPVRDGYVNKV